jgi:hypothetical protein
MQNVRDGRGAARDVKSSYSIGFLEMAAIGELRPGVRRFGPFLYARTAA